MMTDVSQDSVLPQYLVDTDWLERHLSEPSLRLFDCSVLLIPDPPRVYRIETGRADYEREHLPGAGFLDLIGELSDPDSELNFTLPSPERFAEAMSRHGVGPGKHVVLYASSSPVWATRVWWMLKAFGFDEVAILDGGLEKWRREGRPLTQAPCEYSRDNFRARARPGWFVGKHEVVSSLGNPRLMLVNALRPEMHTGEAPVNYGRPGRIPGSKNLYYAELFEEDGHTFKPRHVMQGLLEDLGALAAERVSCYCGGGISATADAFALRMLGHHEVTVYDGSMSEWAGDRDLPMETG